MDRINDGLTQLRLQCVNCLNVIEARGADGRSAQLSRLIHERLLRVEDVIPQHSPSVSKQPPASANQIDLWEAHPESAAVGALIARIRQYETELQEARDWAILNRKRADAAEAGQKVEPLT